MLHHIFNCILLFAVMQDTFSNVDENYGCGKRGVCLRGKHTHTSGNNVFGGLFIDSEPLSLPFNSPSVGIMGNNHGLCAVTIYSYHLGHNRSTKLTVTPPLLPTS